MQKLAEDPQDSVRLLAVEDLIAFGKLFTQEQNQEHLLPIFKALAEDKSWRVRYMVASEYVEVRKNNNDFMAFSMDMVINGTIYYLFCKIAQAFGDAIVQEHFTAPFLEFLDDPEGEVRTAATGRITGMYLLNVGIANQTTQSFQQASPSLWTRRSLLRNCCPA